MDSEILNLEKRLVQLQTESKILDRIIYKGKNQHRRCIYFHYLLKVRRDVRLLQSSNLVDSLSSLLQINAKKHTRTVPQSLKKRGYNSTKYNFREKLLGVARLLSHMVAPIVKAAIEISSLFARSFFMGFSLTILALLARLRVLVQQMLLDVVSIFNTVSSLSQKEHSGKLTQEGMEVLREYHPLNEVITLECVWESDKFVLLERINEIEATNQDGNHVVGRENSSTIPIPSNETFLGEDELGCKRMDWNRLVEDLRDPKRLKIDASADKPFKVNCRMQSEACGNDKSNITH